MSKTARERVISYDLGDVSKISSVTDAKHYIEFFSANEGRFDQKFRKLTAGSGSDVVKELDYLVVKSAHNINFEISTYNGLLLFPHQINNNHPDYPGFTISVYKMRSMNDKTMSESNGDIIISQPQNPHP